MSTRIFDKQLTLQDFTDILGVNVNTAPEISHSIIGKYNFKYRNLLQSERDSLILTILEKLDTDFFQKSGEKRKEQWEQGWKENLKKYLSNKIDFFNLIPGYYRLSYTHRLNGDYIFSEDGQFEYNFYRVISSWLFSLFLNEPETIYEFGAGSAHNVLALSDLFPEKTIFGLDWLLADCIIIFPISSGCTDNSKTRVRSLSTAFTRTSFG